MAISAQCFFPLLELCNQTSEFSQIHSTLIKLGLIQNPLFSTRLISSFSLSSSCSPQNILYARRLFSLDTNPNTFVFNVLIRGHSQCDQHNEALFMFHRMIAHSNAKPNSLTFPFVLKACSAVGDFELGRSVHGMVCKMEMQADPFVGNGLIRLYSKSGYFDDACKVLDRMVERDVVLWNTMMGGFVDAGMMEKARELFDAMNERNVASWNCLIRGYMKCGSMEIASGLFECMPVGKDGITWNTMIGGYAGLGWMEKAHELFKKMPKDLKDLITVNSMIDGHVKVSGFREALVVFDEMVALDIKPNQFTLVNALSACSQLSALEQGERIHSYAAKWGVKVDAVLGTALSDFYAKCGNMERALEVFREIEEKDIGAWNSVISNLGIHGRGKEALRIFSEVLETQTKPDEITFLSVLSACRHSGLVEEGRKCFTDMHRVYGMAPKAEHFGCIVDLLCRAWLLDEAKELIEANAGVEFSVAMWGALLEAASRAGNVEMGEYAAKHLLNLDPNDARCYVALSNLYSRGQKWEDSLRLRRQMRSGGIEKVPGCSLIEVNGVVHEFRVGSGFNTLDEME